MYIVAGLGNPGLRYKKTRHNAGFMAADELAQRWGIRLKPDKFEGLSARCNMNGQDILLLKPQTYMNLSGNCIYEAARFYKVPIENIIVLYDDIDIDFGKLRVRGKGSAGTHNGMRSIVARMHSMDFPRVRIGVGKGPGYIDLKDWVLMKMKKEELEDMERCCKGAADAVEEIIKNGVESAQTKFNGNAR